MTGIVGDFVERHDVISYTYDVETTHVLIHVLHERWQYLTLIVQYIVNLISMVVVETYFSTEQCLKIQLVPLLQNFNRAF
jgi:hypothetical protein